MNHQNKFCNTHKENQAVAFCKRCNVYICKDCIIIIENKKWCKKCYEDFKKRSEQNNPHKCINHPDLLGVSYCKKCRGYLCQDCLISINEKRYCKKCYAEYQTIKTKNAIIIKSKGRVSNDFDEPENDKAQKKCPYCGEKTQSDAIKCRYCGEWIIAKKEKVPDFSFDKFDKTTRTPQYKKCPQCGNITLNKNSICPSCNQSFSQEKGKDCPQCGHRTTLESRQCNACHYAFNAVAGLSGQNTHLFSASTSKPDIVSFKSFENSADQVEKQSIENSWIDSIFPFLNSKNGIIIFFITLFLITILFAAIASLASDYAISYTITKASAIIMIIQFILLSIFLIYFKSREKKLHSFIMLISLITTLILCSNLFTTANNLSITLDNYNNGIKKFHEKDYENAYTIFKNITKESGNFKNIKVLFDSTKKLFVNSKYSEGLMEFDKNNYEKAYNIFSFLYSEMGNYKNVKTLMDSSEGLKLFKNAYIFFDTKNYEMSKDQIQRFLSNYSSSPKTAQAKLLLDKIKREEEKVKRDAKQKELDEKRKSEIAARNAERESAVGRKAYADILRYKYLDQGLDIKVSVSGRNNTTLKLTFILFNDVWTHRTQQGTLIQEIRAMGFKRFELSDGYDYGRYWVFD